MKKQKRKTEKSVAECLGENLKKLREERDHTQESFARACGLSLSFVQLVERGKKWVGPGTIAVFARTLDVTESRLFLDCAAEPVLDPKQLLLMMSRALGLTLTQETVGKLKVRTPLGTYTALYDAMPDDLARAFTDRCQAPDWNWEKFRRFLS